MGVPYNAGYGDLLEGIQGEEILLCIRPCPLGRFQCSYGMHILLSMHSVIKGMTPAPQGFKITPLPAVWDRNPLWP